jgi:hypothetical protein
MTWLAENSLTIWMLGAIALTMALILFYQARTSGALYGVLGVIAATAALLLISWLIETPREAVEKSLYGIAARVEANDVQGVLSYLAPTINPQLRKDVETLLPLVRVERARIVGAPEITVESGSNPTSATVECRGVVVAVNKKDGMKGGAADQFSLKWVRQGDRWLLDSYKSQENWQRAAAKANQKPSS